MDSEIVERGDTSTTSSLLYISSNGDAVREKERIISRLSQTPSSSSALGVHTAATLFNSPLHTSHSEWIDSPDFSPAKMLYTKVYDTPSKTNKRLNFLTPVSETKVNAIQDVVDTDRDMKPELAAAAAVATTSASIASAALQTQTQVFQKKKVHTMDIFWVILNDIVGKDKMAKFGQYTLRLLIHWASKSESYFSDDTLNYKKISARYNDREKKLDLFMNFLKHPQSFVKIIVILVSALFQERFAGMVKGLSLYRQFLRFGKTPFRVRTLFNKIKPAISANGDSLDLDKLRANLFTKSTLGDLTGLYYCTNDETLLLYKLNFLSDKTLHKVAIRHESLAWYSDTLLGLYNAYENLQSLLLKEMELKIQIQVKSRSRVISRQLLGGSGDVIADERDALKLKEIQFNKTNAYLDIYKGLSDFVFNSYTVFNVPLPFDTLQIWMGISASALSIVKLYRDTKKKLEG